MWAPIYSWRHSHRQRIGFEVVQALAPAELKEGPFPGPLPIPQALRKCLWDPDIPWDRM